jgi:oxygen-independent coproporphyrinogen-3 oxidase
VPGIYISWPFCAQKCTYCNFASGVQPRGLEDDYLTAIADEIAAATFSAPDTLYIGGGTPSGIDSKPLPAPSRPNAFAPGAQPASIA